MARSFYNEHEAQFVVFLIQFTLSCDIEPSSVGVITLYRLSLSFYSLNCPLFASTTLIEGKNAVRWREASTTNMKLNLSSS